MKGRALGNRCAALFVARNLAGACGWPTINGFSLTGRFLPGPPLLSLVAAFNQIDEFLLAVNAQL